MIGRVIYRLPLDEQVTLIEGEVREVNDSSISAMGSGYIIAPFLATAAEQTVMITPERMEQYDSIDKVPAISGFDASEEAVFIDKDCTQDKYVQQFGIVHDAITKGRCNKIVLARSRNITTNKAAHPMDLFRQACLDYPRMMISLFTTPVSGMWLMATPEVLLERSGGEWHTMALAGTMRWSEDAPEWSEKDRQEQHYVETYINDIIGSFTQDITTEGPSTARAAHLIHLKTDFRFRTASNIHEGDILRMLHPTPAVCGLPCDTAYGIINRCNSSMNISRHYFSGYSGPIGINGKSHIFVSLRCMQILSERQFTLHAGGGIMPQSTAEKEWAETEAKMETMLNIINKV